jgi:N-acetylmuramoyl-L-alanine amidase CwlA
MTNIDESLTAKGFTPAASVPQVFGRARTLDGIVIHHWGERGQTHDGVNNFFVNGPGSTSAHFVVSEGRITCLVNPADAAWHSGNAVGNATTIGIECRPEATDGDYVTVAELVAFLRSQYGPLPLSPHRDWQATACPGVWDLARIDSLASGQTISTQSSTIAQEEDVANSDLSLQENTQKVLKDNKVVNDSLSVAQALGKLLELNAQLVKSTAANQSTYYVKGDKRPEVYALDVASGKLRHVGSAEFDVVTAINIFKTVPQAKVDALVAGGVA